MPEEAPVEWAEQVRRATATVDGRRIEAADAEPQNWLTHGRDYGEQRHSPLVQFDRDNVDRLGLAWSFETGRDRGHEATPIVVDGVMFVTTAWSEVHALDAKTGQTLWHYDPEVPGEVGRWACCDVVNRGPAVWRGRVYAGVLDGRLVALDAATGSVVWEVQTTDPEQRYTVTGAPRVVDGRVLIGNGGAEYGVRGYLTAYDADTGEQLWRFWTVPGDPALPFEHAELERAAVTWNGEWWKAGGGGTVWDSMAYDPELDLLYVGVGNGAPWTRRHRSPGGGDNLFLSSILALRPDSGRLVWHYQTTPGDNWDYTATQHMVLADLELDGGPRKVLLQAPKNGFFYVLDRETGELLSARNYVQVTWASHVDLDTGRPVEVAGGLYDDAPVTVFPGPSGGHNWHPMSYSPRTGLVYVPAREMAFTYAMQESFSYDSRTWNLSLDLAEINRLAAAAPGLSPYGKLIAWDPVAAEERWSVRQSGAFNGGVLSTAGGLVFQGTSDGLFEARSDDSGELLWQVTLDVGVVAPPISYAVDGEQYVAILAGWGGNPVAGMDAGVSAASMYENVGRLYAFRLGGRAPLPAAVPRDLEIPEPPAVAASGRELERGRVLYDRHCGLCHGAGGVTSGVVADLRYGSSEVHENWQEIVRGGSRSREGMASFRDLLGEEEAEFIRVYIATRAAEDREASANSSEEENGDE